MIARRLGRLAGLAGAAALLAISAPAQAADACKYLKVAELPARFENNRTLLQAEVNGRPVWFMVDTGASSTILFGRALVELGVSTTTAPVEFQGIGGFTQGAQVTLRELKLGGSSAKNVRFYAVLTAGDPLVDGKPVAGLVGLDVLGGFDIEFDLEHGFLRLFRNQGCRNIGLAYWAETFGVAPLQARAAPQEQRSLMIGLNGRPTTAMLDSGSAVTFVTSAAARRVGVTPREMDAATGEETGGIGRRQVETATAMFDSVAIADETVKHARLRVGELFKYNQTVEIGTHIPSQTFGDYQMILGADFLRSHRVLIANSQNKLYFTYNGGTIFQIVGPITPAQATGAAAPSAPQASAQPPAAKPGG